MATFAAATAPAKLAVSEIFGSPLNFTGATRSAPASSGAASASKVVALFSKKKAAAKAKAPPTFVDEELAKWYGK